MKRVTIVISDRERECTRSWLQSGDGTVAIQAEVAGDAEYVPAGTPALARFVPGEGLPPMEVEGRVVGQARCTGSSRVDIAFADEDRRKIEKVMNERESLRVAVDPANPVTAVLSSGEGARVVDLSVDGCLLEFPEFETLPLESWELRLALTIPGEDRRIPLGGEVRKHMRVDRDLMVGVRFHAFEGEDGAATRERLDRFVMARRLEILREEAARRAA